MLVFLFNKHHASGEFSKYTFIQKMKDLTMGKGHKENGSSRCCTHGKKGKAKLDPLGVLSGLLFAADTFLLCLAVESSSCSGDGCGDVAYGVWLAGEASEECLLHPNEPGAVCQDGPRVMLQVTNLPLLGFFPPCSCSLWWQTCGSWSHIFDCLLCWMVQAFIRVSGYFEMMPWALRKELVLYDFPFTKNYEVSRCCLPRAVLVSLECALLQHCTCFN